MGLVSNDPFLQHTLNLTSLLPVAIVEERRW